MINNLNIYIEYGTFESYKGLSNYTTLVVDKECNYYLCGHCEETDAFCENEMIFFPENESKVKIEKVDAVKWAEQFLSTSEYEYVKKIDPAEEMHNDYLADMYEESLYGPDYSCYDCF